MTRMKWLTLLHLIKAKQPVTFPMFLSDIHCSPNNQLISQSKKTLKVNCYAGDIPDSFVFLSFPKWKAVLLGGGDDGGVHFPSR